MPRHATATSFKKGHIPWCKGKKGSRPDVALKNKTTQPALVRSAHQEGRMRPPSEYADKIREGVLQAYAEGRLDTKGLKNGMYGKQQTEHAKQIASLQLKRLNKNPEFSARRQSRLKEWNEKHKVEKSEILKERNKDPEFIKKRLKALCRKPTKPEQWLINLITEYKLPYKYVGDGSFIIGGLNPDFINVNGRKRVIELFGRVWHETYVKGWKRTELGRRMVFNAYGFDTLIIWDDELENKEVIVHKIKEFNKRR